MTTGKTITVVIAGAGGFIGTALARDLAADYRVIRLSRRDPPQPASDGAEWRRCDLFSLFECERALAGADVAFYLVHSMLPSAHLTQGTFQDLDLISADNFARAAAKVGIRQIIYLGGMIPDQPDLSRHILSRGEVERTLGAYGVPVTTLRAGIVIGLRGASYGMFRSILERVPLIPCPRWSASLIQPVALSDALRLLRYCLEHPDGLSRSHDIGSGDIMTYRELLERSARLLGLRRLFFGIPFRFAWPFQGLPGPDQRLSPPARLAPGRKPEAFAGRPRPEPAAPGGTGRVHACAGRAGVAGRGEKRRRFPRHPCR